MLIERNTFIRDGLVRAVGRELRDWAPDGLSAWPGRRRGADGGCLSTERWLARPNLGMSRSRPIRTRAAGGFLDLDFCRGCGSDDRSIWRCAPSGGRHFNGSGRHGSTRLDRTTWVQIGSSANFYAAIQRRTRGRSSRNHSWPNGWRRRRQTTSWPYVASSDGTTWMSRESYCCASPTMALASTVARATSVLRAKNLMRMDGGDLSRAVPDRDERKAEVRDPAERTCARNRHLARRIVIRLTSSFWGL